MIKNNCDDIIVSLMEGAAMEKINGVEPYVVDGFLFGDRKTYNTALSEKKGVYYLKKHNDIRNPEKILSLYNELLEKKVFVTPIGLSYLKELQTLLINSKEIDAGHVRPLFIDMEVEDSGKRTDRFVSDKAKQENAELQKKLDKTGRQKRNSIICNIILLLLVIAMLVIASTTSNANILNYERVLQDKYAGWAEELKVKEQELNQRERELDAISEQ